MTDFEALIQDYKDIDEDDDYESIVKAKQFLQAKQYEKALELLVLVQDNMEKDQRIRTRTHLRMLMQNVFLCVDFPEKMRENDALWLKEVDKHREEIAYIMAIQPQINRKYLESIWEEYEKKALEFAQIYEKVQTTHLTWEQVFEVRHGALKQEVYGQK